jgi:hypothetical protein
VSGSLWPGFDRLAGLQRRGLARRLRSTLYSRKTTLKWELIIVNDGSQDDTAAIATEYAQRDDRITVLHQENRKIPKTLSRGFRQARGQYLTWTSADNRLRPQFLRKMVDCLLRHPDWDLIYANQDIIGDQGQPLRGSGYFAHLQSPPGSEHVHLPDRTELLHSDGNYVGAAFMYRNRVAHLLGDYSSQRFTVEDYDYWLLCDTLLQVAHADFPEPVYEYRFHAGSLTARAKELRIAEARERLLVSDELRQEQCLRPLLWIWEDDDPARASAVLRALREQLSGLHHTLLSHRQISGLALPRHFLPAIFLRLGTVAESQLPPPPDLPEGTLCGYLLRDANPSVTVTPHPQWQVLAAIGTGETPRLRPDSYQGLWRTDSITTLVRALDCRCRVDALRRLEITTEQPTPSGSLTVLIDEAQGTAPLTTLLHSLAMQTLSRNQLEILIIRQARSGQARQRLDSLRATCGDSFVSRLRLIDIPDAAATWSLSAAIAESSSELLCFLTAPPRTPDCLQQLVQTFVRHPELALLREPLPVADLPLSPGVAGVPLRHAGSLCLKQADSVPTANTVPRICAVRSSRAASFSAWDTKWQRVQTRSASIPIKRAYDSYPLRCAQYKRCWPTLCDLVRSLSRRCRRALDLARHRREACHPLAVHRPADPCRRHIVLCPGCPSQCPCCRSLDRTDSSVSSSR